MMNVSKRKCLSNFVKEQKQEKMCSYCRFNLFQLFFWDLSQNWNSQIVVKSKTGFLKMFYLIHVV